MFYSYNIAEKIHPTYEKSYIIYYLLLLHKIQNTSRKTNSSIIYAIKKLIAIIKKNQANTCYSYTHCTTDIMTASRFQYFIALQPIGMKNLFIITATTVGRYDFVAYSMLCSNSENGTHYHGWIENSAHCCSSYCVFFGMIFLV